MALTHTRHAKLLWQQCHSTHTHTHKQRLLKSLSKIPLWLLCSCCCCPFAGFLRQLRADSVVSMLATNYHHHSCVCVSLCLAKSLWLLSQFWGTQQQWQQQQTTNSKRTTREASENLLGGFLEFLLNFFNFWFLYCCCCHAHFDICQPFLIVLRACSQN